MRKVHTNFSQLLLSVLCQLFFFFFGMAKTESD